MKHYAILKVSRKVQRFYWFRTAEARDSWVQFGPNRRAWRAEEP